MPAPRFPPIRWEGRMIIYVHRRSCARGIRPPWMAEVQILQEQISAITSMYIAARALPAPAAYRTSMYIKKPRLDQMPDRGFSVPWKASVFFTSLPDTFQKAYRMFFTPVYSEFISIFMGINAPKIRVQLSVGQIQ